MYRQVAGQRGRNVTICLAISPTNGLVYHTAQIGGMNREGFNAFLMEVGRRLNQDEQTFLIFIMPLLTVMQTTLERTRRSKCYLPIRPS